MQTRSYPVTYMITLLCTVIYAYTMFNPSVYSQFGLVPSFVKEGQFYRLFTYALLHGSMYHIFVNMYSFFYLGTFAEGSLPRGRYILLILLATVGGSLLCCLLGSPNITTVGFSGALYGLLGFYVIGLVKTGMIANQAIRASVIRNLLVNLFISLMPGVSLLGHAGGFAAGIVFGLLFA